MPPVPTPPSPAEGRLYSPINTAYAQEFFNSELVGMYLFPGVENPISGGQTIQFDETHFEIFNTQVSDGDDAPEIQTGYDGDPFVMEAHSIDHPVSDRRKRDANFFGVNWPQRAVRTTMAAMTLKLEYQQSILATTLTNYATTHRITLSGAQQFNDPTSDPETIIDDGQTAIRQRIGREANIMLGGDKAIKRLRRHPLIKAQFHPTNSRTLTVDELAEFFGVQKVVSGKAVYKNAAGQMVDIWGRDIVLAYVPPESLNQSGPIRYTPNRNLDRYEPSYGYTYIIPGHPYARPMWRNEKKRSDMYGVDYERVAVLAGKDRDTGKVISGYLIKDAVAA